ncbi:Scr1 family TA system antitoxin-like transcriptional regulator [Nocardia jejuensis]|uniref:Scr1 family TA system antitoxin-like transcriptional regulator n=1 Tax=Nocardia jejuensis TaxID=328049 RepID=UPI000A517332|nr:Scr1 family TA system antitoxin-like transcriptional regulator [Nocardia jejuensis]
MVYADGVIGSVFHEHDEDVNRYERAIEDIRAVALGEQDTRDLVMKIAKEYAA